MPNLLPASPGLRVMCPYEQATNRRSTRLGTCESACFSKNGVSELTFDSFDGEDKGTHNDVGLVKISEIFMTEFFVAQNHSIEYRIRIQQ